MKRALFILILLSVTALFVSGCVQLGPGGYPVAALKNLSGPTGNIYRTQSNQYCEPMETSRIMMFQIETMEMISSDYIIKAELSENLEYIGGDLDPIGGNDYITRLDSRPGENLSKTIYRFDVISRNTGENTISVSVFDIGNNYSWVESRLIHVYVAESFEEAVRGCRELSPAISGPGELEFIPEDIGTEYTERTGNHSPVMNESNDAGKPCTEHFDCGEDYKGVQMACLGNECTVIECFSEVDCIIKGLQEEGRNFKNKTCFDYECLTEEEILQRYEECCPDIMNPDCECEGACVNCEGGRLSCAVYMKTLSFYYCTECINDLSCKEGHKCEKHSCVPE